MDIAWKSHKLCSKQLLSSPCMLHNHTKNEDWQKYLLTCSVSVARWWWRPIQRARFKYFAPLSSALWALLLVAPPFPPKCSYQFAQIEDHFWLHLIGFWFNEGRRETILLLKQFQNMICLNTFLWKYSESFPICSKLSQLKNCQQSSTSGSAWITCFTEFCSFSFRIIEGVRFINVDDMDDESSSRLSFWRRARALPPSRKVSRTDCLDIYLETLMIICLNNCQLHWTNEI